MNIPRRLEWVRGVPGGGAWLDALPRLAAELAELWRLRLDEPYEFSNVSLAIPAEAGDGTRAVLKINFPGPENEHEAEALAHYGGRGAVLLLAEDEERRALLVERCEPGTRLWDVADDEEATAIAAEVLLRLWRPPSAHHPFRLLADEAKHWEAELASAWEELGRPFERRLVQEAVAALRELGPTQRRHVVCHQDFHGGNVLRAKREPWLAIDPKPLVGEREFDAASLLRDRRTELCMPGGGSRVRRRLDVLAAELALDRERTRRWAIAHALAWGVSGRTRKVEEDMIQCARMLLAAR